PPPQRREELDPVSQDEPRVGPERDHGGRRARAQGRLEHPTVSPVYAVEGADGDHPLARRELAGVERDLHSRASATSAETMRSRSASSTENDPTSVRRRLLQCPPRASAIARTYVPELTRRSSRATPSLYVMTSSAYTRERRSGISTVTPRRARRYA